MKKKPLMRLSFNEVSRLEKLGEAQVLDFVTRPRTICIYDGRIYHKSWSTEEYIFLAEKYKPTIRP